MQHCNMPKRLVWNFNLFIYLFSCITGDNPGNIVEMSPQLKPPGLNCRHTDVGS